MRLQGTDIFRSDFRFSILDGDTTFFVTYNDDDVTVSCGCPRGKQCEHTAFIHETISKTDDMDMMRGLENARVGNSKPINWNTVSRIRGAFAREYNLANGVVQYPDTSPRGPRGPLGWEGNVPGWREKVRVVEIPNQPNVFAVYEANSDKYSTVECNPIPKCNHKDCQDPEREVFCKHEAALREAVFTWQNAGLLPKAKPPEIKRESTTGNKPITLTYDDLKMVERAEPYQRAIYIPPSFDGTSWTVGADLANENIRGIWKSLAETSIQELWSSATQNTIGVDVSFDAKKFEEDVNKAKKLLEKKEEPKPEKPKKPRTRFTDLEL